jgi:hypothetical protein
MACSASSVNSSFTFSKSNSPLGTGDQRVLGPSEDLDQGVLGKLVQRRENRQTADELGDEAELDQVLGLALLEELAQVALAPGDDVGGEAHGLLRGAPLHDRLQPHEGAAADEQDVRRVDLDKLLVRVLAPALRRHVGDRPFEDLRSACLDAFARNVARDGGVLGLAGDLVDLVDVYVPRCAFSTS